MLRRKDGVERRNRRAGALRIEFIERSRNESLGIEWSFAACGAVGGGKTGQLEDGVVASSVKTTGAYGRRENSWKLRDRSATEIC